MTDTGELWVYTGEGIKASSETSNVPVACLTKMRSSCSHHQPGNDQGFPGNDLLHAGKQDHETAVWGSLCRDKAGVIGGTEATDSQEKGGRGLWDSGGDWKLRCHAEPGSDRQKQLGGPVDP